MPIPSNSGQLAQSQLNTNDSILPTHNQLIQQPILGNSISSSSQFVQQPIQANPMQPVQFVPSMLPQQQLAPSSQAMLPIQPKKSSQHLKPLQPRPPLETTQSQELILLPPKPFQNNLHPTNTHSRPRAQNHQSTKSHKNQSQSQSHSQPQGMLQINTQINNQINPNPPPISSHSNNSNHQTQPQFQMPALPHLEAEREDSGFLDFRLVSTPVTFVFLPASSPEPLNDGGKQAEKDLSPGIQSTSSELFEVFQDS